MDCMMNEQPKADNRTFMMHALAESKTQEQLAAEVIDRITTGFSCTQPEELRRILHKYALNCAGTFQNPLTLKRNSKKTLYFKNDDKFPEDMESFKIVLMMTVFVAMNGRSMLQAISSTPQAHNIKSVADFQAEFCRDITIRHLALCEGEMQWEIVTEIHNTVRLLEFSFGAHGNKRAFAYVAGILSVPATHAQFLAVNFTVNSFGGRETPRVKMLKDFIAALLNLPKKKNVHTARRAAAEGLLALMETA